LGIDMLDKLSLGFRLHSDSTRQVIC
jgi:hypothetical protein